MKTIITLSAICLTTSASIATAVTQNVTKPQISQEEKKATPYPLKVCIVSDEDLDSMDEEMSFIYKDQEIKVCCKPCIKKFKKAPKKFIAKLAELSKKKK